EPRYVETLPGRGYRFIAPISRVNGSVLEIVPASATATAESGLPRPRRLAWIVAGGAALVVLVASVLASRSSPVSLKAARFLVSPPKGYYVEAGGIRRSFALSPDGERIAFTAKNASGAFRVFLRNFSEPEARPVADGDGAYSVFWSADGQ